MNNNKKDHYLDVTDLVKKHGKKSMPFVLVRETRHIGDDVDKGKEVKVSSSETSKRPQLLYWITE